MAKRHTKPRTSAKAVSQPERTTPVETPQAAARDVTDGLPSIDSAAAIALAGKAYDAVDAAFQTARKRHDAELADAIREFQGFAEQWQQDLKAPTQAKIAAEAILEQKHTQRRASEQHSGASLMRESEVDFATMRDAAGFNGPLMPTAADLAMARKQLASTGNRSNPAPTVSPQNTEPAAAETASIVMDDDAYFLHTDLADRYKVAPESARKRLERWRQKCPDGWREVADRRGNEPRYTYRLGAVRHLFEKPDGASAPRPAK